MDTPFHLRRRQLTLFAAVAFLFLSFATSASTLLPSRRLSVGARRAREEAGEVPARRRLWGLGSSPPSCRSKCGWCTPCKAVHVAIHPGFSMKLEYYPEAWRCKCRDKMFMP